MITASQFRTKATISVIYLVLFTFLGAYSLVTKTELAISSSTQKTAFTVSLKKS